MDHSPELDLLIAEVAELRPLPAVAVRALEIAEGEHFSAHELAQAISADQALTAKLLRLSNSAYYGFPRRITTVRDAVVLLGSGPCGRPPSRPASSTPCQADP